MATSGPPSTETYWSCRRGGVEETRGRAWVTAACWPFQEEAWELGRGDPPALDLPEP